MAFPTADPAGRRLAARGRARIAVAGTALVVAVLVVVVIAAAGDPLLTAVQRITSRIQAPAASGGGRWLLLGAAALIAGAALAALWQWARAPHHIPAADREWEEDPIVDAHWQPRTDTTPDPTAGPDAGKPTATADIPPGPVPTRP